ncbi:RNA-directed DNA polymerase from mobile element jockey [Elysia marginata]|uniref:RNA-directed DNA polymerase from mobile element jockey n=1 Tax=Elysia marginata TaxID=1093978 RepID=A0AAV4ITM5_9GAST|nr:RNA-directed DNA polymerase from mobile element jockey [Elysia marginata]
MVMGDFNGKVGQRRDPWTKHLGPFSDNTATCNYNGNLILELCAEHELVIANTLFQHRQSRIITWYKWNNLDVCSQFDFVLVRTKMRSTLRNTRVIPNAELDTDHRPIITTRTQKQKTSDKNKARANKTSKKRVINMKKLQSGEAQTKTNSLVNEKLKSVDTKDMNVTDLWNTFKSAVTDSMKEACGTKKQGGPTRKLTAWWNEEIKKVIQTKKKLFKNCQRPQRTTPVRRRPDQRKVGRVLLRLTQPGRRPGHRRGFDPSQPDHQEPNILESEVRWAVKDSPKDKAAGDDGITTRAVLACGEIGIQWLTSMFQRAWEESKVPDDWQRAIVVPIWKCKGSKKDCSTYRGISLLSHVGKMFAKILERRIRAKTEHLLSNSSLVLEREEGAQTLFLP